MALFNVKVNDKENALLFNQLICLVVVIILLNILLSIGYSESPLSLISIFSNGFLNADLINIFMFVLLSILGYNLVIRKIIMFY